MDNMFPDSMALQRDIHVSLQHKPSVENSPTTYIYGPGNPFNATNSNPVSSVRAGPLIYLSPQAFVVRHTNIYINSSQTLAHTASTALRHLSLAMSSDVPWISGRSRACDCSSRPLTSPRMARTSVSLLALPVMKLRVLESSIVLRIESEERSIRERS